MDTAICAQTGCRKPAKAVLDGRWLCGNHHRHLRNAAARLQADAITHVEILIDNYVPEMRDQDDGMLRRIAERGDDAAAGYEMRLHMAARTLAAQRVLAERELVGAELIA